MGKRKLFGSVRVVNLFVSLCPLHKQQQTITRHVKHVTKPMELTSFLSSIEREAYWTLQIVSVGAQNFTAGP